MPEPKTPKDRACELLVTFLGCGRLPIASGTWGTLGAVVAHWIVQRTLGTAEHPYVLPALAAAFTAACIWSCPWAERFYRKKDPSPFVIDEVAGYFLAVSFFPSWSQWRVGLLGFFLFRIFDVVKPPPARRFEKLPAGWGIVLDDLVAGLYAALFIWLVSKAFL